TDFSEMIKCDPDSELAYYRRGVAYNRLHKLSLARSDCNKALLMSPGHIWVLQLRSAVELDQGDWQACLTDCQQALAIDPGIEGAHFVRASAYLKSKRPKLALADADYLIKQYPGDGEYFKLRGQIYAALGDEKAASEDLNEYMQLKGGDYSFTG